MRHGKLIGLAVVGVVGIGWLAVIAQQQSNPTPEKAATLMKNGNWKEAFVAYSRLVLERELDASPEKLPEYFNNAMQCAQQLDNYDESEAFREKAIAAHPKNWRLLQAAANSYENNIHHGYIVADQFHRGWARGGRVRYVNAFERDRVRAQCDVAVQEARLRQVLGTLVSSSSVATSTAHEATDRRGRAY